MKNRRKFLKTAGLTALGMSVAKSGIAAESCALTPTQAEGPFYPESWKGDSDFDLTFVKDRSKEAMGDKFILSGRILDASCKAVPGAIVEIWQAAASGKYNHSSDPNTARLDPNFQYWGRVITNAKGEYKFKTIVPGEYPASPGWIRPPHIHVKVLVKDQRTLTTQLYFRGNQYNAKDRILNSLTKAQRERVMIDLKEIDGESADIGGQRDITLNFSQGGNGTPELN